MALTRLTCPHSRPETDRECEPRLPQELPRLASEHSSTVDTLLPLWRKWRPEDSDEAGRSSLLRLCLVVQWNAFEGGLFLHQALFNHAPARHANCEKATIALSDRTVAPTPRPDPDPDLEEPTVQAPKTRAPSSSGSNHNLGPSSLPRSLASSVRHGRSARAKSAPSRACHSLSSRQKAVTFNTMSAQSRPWLQFGNIHPTLPQVPPATRAVCCCLRRAPAPVGLCASVRFPRGV